ncbi:hypothetical protein KGF54_003709 [Candida jiufengensis]|uniref:uncharacterized protein n=1 Tax=Candida jiufengensis TaxID=497108 RepID=UPI002224B2CC|nr:uncharacterized protein KGF54_003709 [Candida jiufengensis]KAI5952842.1 hypothetical protein KGF54_003709 [Candida jiufengensis]
MYLLTEVTNFKAISNSISLNVHDYKFLLVNAGNSVRFYKYANNELVFKMSSNLRSNILSWTNFTYKSKQYILLVDDIYYLHVMDINSTKIVDDLTVTIRCIAQLSTKGQQQAPDIEKPIMIPSSPTDPNFILCHLFQTNIQMIPVSDIAKSASDSQEPLNILSAPIGNIDIKQIVSLNDGSEKNKSPSFAALYKDITSSYYIRVLQYNPKENNFNISRQFSSFDESPSLIFSYHQKLGGIFALTDSSLFYFPPEHYQYVSSSKLIKNVFISTKSKDNYLVLTVSKPSRGKNVMIYKSFEYIDEYRTLLVTADGKCFMLYMDVEVSSRNSLVINQINMIDLGDLTIPLYGGLHHLGSNKFIQFSKVSRSVLFEILPNRPNINILDYIESSPPVLDIKTGYKPEEIYTCQGGWEGSELRKYAEPICDYKILKSNKIESYSPFKIGRVDNKFVFGDLLKNTTPRKAIYINDDLEASIEEQEFDLEVLDMLRTPETELIITSKALKHNTNTILEAPIQFGKIIPEYGVVLMVSGEKIYLYDYFKGKIEEIKLNVDDGEVSSIDAYRSNDEFWIISTFYSGLYQVWHVNETSKQLQHSDSIKGESPSAIYSCCIAKDKTSDSLTFRVFLMSLNGSLLQLLFSFHSNTFKLIYSNLSVLNQSLPLLIIRKFDDIVIYNSKMVYIPQILCPSRNYCYTKIPKKGIANIEFVEGEEDQVIVFFENGLIEKWGIDFLGVTSRTIEPQSIFSNKLFVKCLPMSGGEYMVAVSYDQYNPNTDFTSELLLVELHSFTVVDRFKLYNNAEVSDLCEFEGKVANLVHTDYKKFVCLTSSDKSSLYIFSIQDSKLKLINKEAIPKVDLNTEVKFSSISQIPHDPNKLDNGVLFLLSGNIIMQIQLIVEDRTYKAVLHQTEDIQPAASFTVAQSCVSNKVAYLADALDGIFEYNISPNISLSKAKIENAPEENYSDLNQLLTCLSVAKSDEISNILISGDSLGNIRIFDRDTNTGVTILTSKFNIDLGQINAITTVNRPFKYGQHLATIGNLSGGLYNLYDITSQEMKQILISCDLELDNYGEKFRIMNMDYKEIDAGNILIPETSAYSNIIDARAIKSYLGNYEKISKSSEFETLAKYKDKLSDLIDHCK